MGSQSHRHPSEIKLIPPWRVDAVVELGTARHRHQRTPWRQGGGEMLEMRLRVRIGRHAPGMGSPLSSAWRQPFGGGYGTPSLAKLSRLKPPFSVAAASISAAVMPLDGFGGHASAFFRPVFPSPAGFLARRLLAQPIGRESLLSGLIRLRPVPVYLGHGNPSFRA